MYVIYMFALIIDFVCPATVSAQRGPLRPTCFVLLVFSVISFRRAVLGGPLVLGLAILPAGVLLLPAVLRGAL